MIKSSPSLKSVNFCGGKDEDGQVSNSVDATWMHLVAFRPRQVGAVRRRFCASTSLYFRGNYAPPLRSRRRQCTGPLLADGRHSWAIVVRFARVCRATGREAVHAAVRAPGLLLQRRHLPSHDVTQQKVLRVSNDVRVGFPPRASAPRRVMDRRAERSMEINEIAENFGPGRLRSSFVPDRAHVFNSLFSFQSVYYKNKTNIY